MDEIKPQKLPAPATEFERLQTLRQQRYEAIKAEIPTAPWAQLTKSQRQIVENYIALAVGTHGRRSLSRVVWPWTYRSTVADRAPRGRLSNPTALR